MTVPHSEKRTLLERFEHWVMWAFPLNWYDRKNAVLYWRKENPR